MTFGDYMAFAIMACGFLVILAAAIKAIKVL